MEQLVGHDFGDEDGDTFTCGRCSSQFFNLASFVNHKVCCKLKLKVNEPGLSVPSTTTAEISTQRNATSTADLITNYTDAASILSNRASPLFRAIVFSNNETLTFDIPIEQFPPGYFVQSVRGERESPVLSVPDNDNELTTLTSHLNIEVNGRGEQHLPTSSVPTSSPDFETEVTDLVNYQNNHVITLEYSTDASGSNLKSTSPETSLNKFPDIASSSSPDPEHRESLTPVDGCIEDNSIELNSKPFEKRGRVRNRKECHDCGESFKTLRLLETHRRSHSGEKPFPCRLCGNRFTLKSNLRKHMNTHKVWPKLKSTLPKVPFTEVSTDKIDSDTVENGTTLAVECIVNNTYDCQYCDGCFGSYLELKSHLKVHKIEKVFKCVHTGCEETFSDFEKLISHSESHNLRIYCTRCTAVFSNLQDLHHHEVEHNLSSSTSALANNLECKDCGSKYKSRSALDHHLLTSSHKYPCSYSQCNRVFHTERYLRRHLKLHTTVKGFNCSECDKSFNNDAYLKSHLRTHFNRKSFRCPECSALFGRRDSLGRHIRSMHQREQRLKHACSFAGCTMEFLRKDKWKDHVWSHSRKVYVCRKCDSSFFASTELRQHQVHAHRELFLLTTCSECKKIFKTKHHLKIHICKGLHSSASSQNSPSKYNAPKFDGTQAQNVEQGHEQSNTPTKCDIKVLSRSKSVRPVRKCAKKLNYVLHHMVDDSLPLS